MTMSSSTTSIGSAAGSRSRPSAWRPSAASTVRCPIDVSSRTSSRRLKSVSSTTRMRPPVIAGPPARRSRHAAGHEAGLEHVGGDRLGDVVVHARRDACLAVAVHGVRRHRHDARSSHPRPAVADPAGRLEAVELRHLDVHEHEVVAGTLDRGDRLEPVGPPRPPGSRSVRVVAGRASGSRDCPRPAGCAGDAGRRGRDPSPASPA